MPINLQLYRRSVSTAHIKFDTIIRNSVDQHQPLNINLFEHDEQNHIHRQNEYLSSIHASESIHSIGHSPKPIRRTAELYASLMMSPIDRHTAEQSDESESGVGSESNPYSDGDEEQRLVSIHSRHILK